MSHNDAKNSRFSLTMSQNANESIFSSPTSCKLSSLIASNMPAVSCSQSNIPPDLSKLPEEMKSKCSFSRFSQTFFSIPFFQNFSFSHVRNKISDTIDDITSKLKSLFGQKNPIFASLQFYSDSIDIFIMYTIHKFNIPIKKISRELTIATHLLGGLLLVGIGYSSLHFMKRLMQVAKRDPTAAEWFEKGNLYYTTSDSLDNRRKALSCYLAAAKLNHEKAQVMCGTFYRKGIGCKRNLGTAFKFYEVVSKQSNNAEAHFQLAELLLQGYEPTLIEDERAVERMHARASESNRNHRCNSISNDSFNSDSSEISNSLDYIQDANSSHKSQDTFQGILNYGKSQRVNNFHRIKNEVNEQDTNNGIKSAFYHYTLASEYGHVKSLNRLAIWYDLGYHVPMDREKALQLYLKAAQNGSSLAMKEVVKRYENGVGTPVDLGKAKLWKLKIKGQ